MHGRYLITLVTALAFFTVGPAVAQDLFVDYATGRDSNDGLSRETSWKHAPGDPNATEKADRYIPEGGDVIYFKGGVEYLGGITLPSGGDDGNPITYSGNGWGEERALISGAKKLNIDLKPCQSAEDCYGNPNWRKLFKADIQEAINPLTPMFLSGERIWLSRDPNQPDPFWFDDYEYYYNVGGFGTEMTKSSVILGPDLDDTGDENWQNAIIALWMKPNQVLLADVIGIDRTTGTINFDPPGNDPYTDRDSYYALFNRPSDIDQPGEYFVDNNAQKIIVWPENAERIKENNLSINDLPAAFVLNGNSNVVIEGFHISHYFGDHNGWDSGTAVINSGQPVQNVIIRDNYIDHLRSVEGVGAIQIHKAENAIVENNTITNSQKSSGIRYGFTTNSIIHNNTIRKIGRTGIRLIETENIQISGNHLADILGVHGNGISVYLKNQNILVASNILENVPFAFTYHGTGKIEEANNMWLLNNVFMGRVRSWGSAFDRVYYLHNLVYAEVERSKAVQIPSSEPRTTIRNNVLDGLIAAPPPEDWTLSHNIYTALAWPQSPKYGWAMEPGGSMAEDYAARIERFAKERPQLMFPSGDNIYSLLPVKMFPQYDFSHWNDVKPIGPSFIQKP